MKRLLLGLALSSFLLLGFPCGGGGGSHHQRRHGPESPIPEPAAIVLVLVGLAAVAWSIRRNK